MSADCTAAVRRVPDAAAATLAPTTAAPVVTQAATSAGGGGRFLLRGVSKQFERGRERAGTALAIDALDIPLGGIIAIVGGSGSGKTTLLNLLGGLERAQLDQHGRFELELPGDNAARHLDRQDYPRRRASYVFQQGYLLSQASIALNLEITRRAAGHAAPPGALLDLLSEARLDTARDAGATVAGQRCKTLSDRAVTLSGGQQQRLNIARALGRDPTLLFADELSSSLDPQTAVEVLSALKNWVREERGAGLERTRLPRTMLWVTHDYALASRFADALIVLAPGRPMPDLVRPIELTGAARKVTPADIETWLREGKIPERWLSSPDSTPDGAPVTPPATEAAAIPLPVNASGALAERAPASLALSLANMWAGVRLSVMEAFREPRHSMDNRLLRALAAPLRFAHWVRALQLAAVLALVLIVTFGRSAVSDYFDSALDDPSLRHVIVQQNVRELRRSTIDEASLRQLSETIDASGPPASEDEPARWGFGRFTESVDVYPQDRDDIAQGFVAELTIGIMERAEPVYAGLAVAALGEGLPGCEGGVISSPGKLLPYADELALIVSRRYVAEARRMFDIDLCARPYVDLWDAGRPLTFRIVGVTESLPADGYDRFDAVMQADVWRNWIARVGKPPRAGFSRAAVYFDQGNHGTVIDALRERAFAFDEEIVSKFERLIGTAAKLRNTFVAMTWLSLVVALTVAAGLIWGYLKQNAKAIALLRAHGAWVAPLLSAIPFQLLLTYVYSLSILALAVGAWNLLAGHAPLVAWLAQASDGALTISPLGIAALMAARVPLAATLLIMIAVGLASLAVWSVTHANLAHELRDTE